MSGTNPYFYASRMPYSERPRHVGLGATALPPSPAVIPACLTVPCRPGLSGWTLVGIALAGLALNVFRVVKPARWGLKETA